MNGRPKPIRSTSPESSHSCADSAVWPPVKITAPGYTSRMCSTNSRGTSGVTLSPVVDDWSATWM